MAPNPYLRIFVSFLFACSPLWAQVSVLTANYGNERTNANSLESVLNPSNVIPQSFGRLATLPVDGQIYAQPLIVAGTKGNVLYVATMHNSVYAFNADDLSTTTPIWTRNLGASVPNTFLQFRDIQPEVGILSTPVIDPSRNTIYLVADTFNGETAEFHLHALDLTDGSEKPGSPIVIGASVIGDGDQSDDGKILLDASQHLQRPSLLLANRRLYIAFGSHADQYPYHGWVLAYDADDIRKQTAVFNTTPHGSGGSIWQSGRGLAADADGVLYLATANGDYDGAQNFSQTYLKLSPDLKLLDWFTPHDWSDLSDGDWDLGSLGPVLVPGYNSLIGGDKAGNLYLVPLTSMGQLGTDGADVPQILPADSYGGIYNIALWNSIDGPIAYVVEQGDSLKAYRLTDHGFDAAPYYQTTVTADIPFQGMTVSSNGADPSSGILWMTTGDHDQRSVPGTLHALNAGDLTELWNSDMNIDRDQLGRFAKFVSPTVANSRVFVPTFSNQVAVYGLLPQ